MSVSAKGGGRRRSPPAWGDPGPPPTAAELKDATRIVDESGVVPRLAKGIDASMGRPRLLTVRGWFVAATVNGIRQHHKAHLIQITRVLNSMTPEQRSSLGITSWPRAGAYKRVVYLFHKMSQVLES
jgi:hypothetical protein